MNDPFHARYRVPVEGGVLQVAAAGTPPGQAEQIVLLVHGITASHVAWRAVARGLNSSGGRSVLAPDLRGRGASAALSGPYGSAAHVADLLAVMDRVGIRRALLGGHSMGAFVAARLAAEHPERVSGLVLVDGGLPIPIPAEADHDRIMAATLGPALDRLGRTFPTRDEYVSRWRSHPAFARAWNADVEAYVEYDLEPVREPAPTPAVRSAVSPEAVWTDGRELLACDAIRTAVDRVEAPIWLLRAPRGPLDDDRALIPETVLVEFITAHPGVLVETVRDTNHYTILLGDSPGPSRVIAAFAAAQISVPVGQPTRLY